jgi:hypothetical protein
VPVTLLATQQLRLELAGSTMYHQPPSPDFPTIWAEAPTFKPLVTIHAVPGPRRQLTLTSLEKATGTVGVEVVVGGGVSEGTAVCVAVDVARNKVAVGLTSSVAVGVTGRFEGRLQAERQKTSARVNHILLNRITLLLVSCLHYLMQKSRRWQ